MTTEWMTGLMTVMLAASLRVCLVAGAVGGILLLARIRSGGVRHAAWSAVLAAMLLMPVLPYYLPRVEIPLPLRARSVEAIPAAIESAWRDTDPQALEPASPLAAPSSPASPAPSVPAVPATPRVAWPFVLMGVYLAGALLFLTRLGSCARSPRRGSAGWRRGPIESTTSRTRGTPRASRFMRRSDSRRWPGGPPSRNSRLKGAWACFAARPWAARR